MRNIDSESFIDLAALSLRWLFLIGVGAWLLLTGGGNTGTAAVLLAAGVLNAVLLAFLLYSNWKKVARRTTSLAVDLLVANLLFYASAGRPDSLVWVGLLPVITAAMLFESRVLLISILISIFTIGIQGLVFFPPDAPVLFISWMILGFSLGGLTVLYLRHALLNRYERTRRVGEVNGQEFEQIAGERARTLAQISEALNKDLEAGRIYDAALSNCLQLLSPSPDPEGQPVGAMLLLAKSESGTICLQVTAASRFSTSGEKVCLSSSGGLITRSLEEGRPRLSKEISKDPELNRFSALRACQAVYCIPVTSITDANALGVLLLAHPDESIFTQERRETLEMIGRMAGLAIRNARRYHDLDLERQRLIEILQENRNRLVRELHDGSTQSVSALALRANLIRRTFERDGKMSVEELQKLEDLARTTAKEIRQMLFTMRPLEQKPDGERVSLENLASQVRKSFGKNVDVAVDPDVFQLLAPKKQAVVYYVAEEAIEIAHRSGITEPVVVRFDAREDELACLEIDYPGYPGNTADLAVGYENRNSLSVSNMRERAALVNGYLDIVPTEDQRLRIRLLVPITEEAAERLRDRQ